MTVYDTGLITTDVPGTTVLAQYPVHERWNGWLRPSLDADGIVQALSQLEDCEWSFDGETLVLTDPGYPADGPYRIQPDADGLYSLAGFGWCWFEAGTSLGAEVAS